MISVDVSGAGGACRGLLFLSPHRELALTHPRGAGRERAARSQHCPPGGRRDVAGSQQLRRAGCEPRTHHTTPPLSQSTLPIHPAQINRCSVDSCQLLRSDVRVDLPCVEIPKERAVVCYTGAVHLLARISDQ